MLTEAKNQLKVIGLSLKYSLMREMLNKASFVSNIFFMILNNSCMIVQWIILFSIKEDFGGYTFKDVLLLWGLAATIYGFAHFFFRKSFSLSGTIVNGKLDAYIVQPKNILLSIITSEITVSAIGDFIFGYIMYFIYGFSIESFILFTLFTITGGLMLTSASIILNSLSFWFTNSDMIADVGNSLLVNFATYPDGIFKNVTKVLLYTLVPVGVINYIPINVILNFNIYLLLINVCISILLVLLAFIVFNRGLKRYSSSNLMNARI